MSGVNFTFDMPGDIVDPVKVGNRCAAKLHDYAGHIAISAGNPVSGQEKPPRGSGAEVGGLLAKNPVRCNRISRATLQTLDINGVTPELIVQDLTRGETHDPG
jgi:hypothetical protein